MSVAVSAGIKAIEIPELGNAREQPDPSDPLLASLELAAKASALRRAFTEDGEMIDKLERDVKVDTNKQQLMTRFGNLNEMKKDEPAKPSAASSDTVKGETLRPAADPIQDPRPNPVADPSEAQKHNQPPT